MTTDAECKSSPHTALPRWPDKPGAIFLVTRDELYEYVWSTPIQTLAAKLNISGNALAKICKTHGIPVPSRGYWALHAAKQMSSRPKLPEWPDGHSKPIRLTVHQRRAALDEFPEIAPAPMVALESDPRRFHPLVKAARTAANSANLSEFGAVRPGSGHLGIRASPQSLDRALAITDALIKALTSRGHGVAPSDYKHGGTVIHAFGVGVKFYIDERIRREPHKETEEERLEEEKWERKYGRRHRLGDWSIPSRPTLFRPRWDFFPSGELLFIVEEWSRIPVRRNWRDTPRRRLEDLLPDIVVGIERVATVKRKEALHRQEEERRQEELQRHREAEAARCRIAAKKRQILLRQSLHWERLCRLRTFIEAVEADAIRRNKIENPDVIAWLAWARQIAAEIDPLADGLDLNTYAAVEVPEPQAPWETWQSLLS